MKFPVYGSAKAIMNRAFTYGQTISGDELGIESRGPIFPEVPRYVVSLEPPAWVPRR